MRLRPCLSLPGSKSPVPFLRWNRTRHFRMIYERISCQRMWSISSFPRTLRGHPIFKTCFPFFCISHIICFSCTHRQMSLANPCKFPCFHSRPHHIPVPTVPYVFQWIYFLPYEEFLSQHTSVNCAIESGKNVEPHMMGSNFCNSLAEILTMLPVSSYSV